jgi:hypothetical protein
MVNKQMKNRELHESSGELFGDEKWIRDRMVKVQDEILREREEAFKGFKMTFGLS